MIRTIGERIRATQRNVRAQLLQTVFTQFDEQLMTLGDEQRQAKYDKMALTPFSFFRGSAYLFYFDVGREWFPYHTSLERPTWIQGDLHFENFGAFHNQKGEIVYDINDFDEGYLGSYMFDLMRMSVSIVLVSRMKGWDTNQTEQAVQQYLANYYKQMKKYAKGKQSPAEFSLTRQNTTGLVKKLLKKLEKRRSHHLLDKVTAYVEQERKFAYSEEILPVTDEQREAILAVWPAYLQTIERASDFARYQIKDIAIKLGSGTASIGLDRFYILIEGGESSDELDDIILEMKEVRAPIPGYFLPYNADFWREYPHHGHRVVTTQRAMHHKADPHLGYVSIGDKHYYIRERSPYKKKIKLEQITDVEEFQEILYYMGKMTAKMHARADEDVASGVLPYHSEQEIYAAIGNDGDQFVANVTQWAISYANQVEEDYSLFLEYVKK